MLMRAKLHWYIRNMKMIHKDVDKKNISEATNQIAWLPLLCAIAIMVILSIYPNVLVNQHGGVDKISTYLLFWAMASGFIRGVGFIPQSRFLAVLFSGTACFITLFASLIHLKFF